MHRRAATSCSTSPPKERTSAACSSTAAGSRAPIPTWAPRPISTSRRSSATDANNELILATVNARYETSRFISTTKANTPDVGSEGALRRPVIDNRVAPQPVHDVANLLGCEAILFRMSRIGGEGRHAVVVFAVEPLVRRIADKRRRATPASRSPSDQAASQRDRRIVKAMALRTAIHIFQSTPDRL